MSEPKTWPTEWTEEVRQALLAPFPAEALGFLPRAQSNGKALAICYIDARTVMSRLDTVVGPHNWTFDFDPLDNQGKMVRGRLTILGSLKCDAGEAAQEDEPLKSAVSDALKRAAVHFGVGRYLYELPKVWAPYDAQKRKFTEEPRIHTRDVEAAARLAGFTGTMPKSEAPAPRPAPPESNGDRNASRQAPPQAQAAVQGAEKQLPITGSNTPAPDPPVTGGMFADEGSGALPFCADCKADGLHKEITKAEANYSRTQFGKCLCRVHQTEAKKAQGATAYGAGR